ncbi:MAG: LrgA, partial [Dokdonella sp.]
MNAVAPTQNSWNKVERVASLTLITCLLAFVGCRLAFAVWWPLYPVDFVISALAVILLTGSFWFAAHRRALRIAVIVYASATQLVPLVIRHPLLLLPLLGAMIPLAILLGCLFALSN